MSMDDTTASHLQELRRGTVVLGCLMRLRTPDYGYALLESLNGIGITVDANTLYPLLRRLEKQGLLTSEWNTDEARPRKFYSTSPAGEQLAAVLTADWHLIDRALTRLTTGDAPGATDTTGTAGTTGPTDTADHTDTGDER